MSGYWEELARPGPKSVMLETTRLRAGSRVVLRPRPGGDIFDLALAGRTAVIEAIEEDTDGTATLAVVVEDDPGRDLGLARQPGHRFFFSLSEVEPLGDDPAPAPRAAARVLLAGIGNVFLGDDGFGVALVDRIARRELRPGVEAVDYGIRGMDLALAMPDYDVVVLLDATPRGEPPGTLYVVEVDPADADLEPGLDTHGMDPVKVIALVRALGGTPPRTFVVGCEPKTLMSAGDEEVVAQLSEPVLAALDPAVKLVESLLADIDDERNQPEV